MLAHWPRRIFLVCAAIAIWVNSGFGLISAPFRLEMVLGQPERLESQLLGQDALADLVHQHLLRCGMHLGQRAVVHRDAVLGDDHRKAATRRCGIHRSRTLPALFALISLQLLGQQHISTRPGLRESIREGSSLQQSILRIPDTIRTDIKAEQSASMPEVCRLYDGRIRLPASSNMSLTHAACITSDCIVRPACWIRRVMSCIVLITSGWSGCPG